MAQPRAMAVLQQRWQGLPGPLRDAAVYGASLGFTKALAMLTLPVLTAHLLPADFARIELLSSAAEIAALFACAGLVDTAYRFASGGDGAARRAASQILGLALSIAAISLLLCMVLAPRIAALMPLHVRALEIRLLGTAVALEALIALPMAFLRMQGKAASYAAATSLRAALQSSLVVALVLAGFGVSGVLAAGAVTAVLTAAWLTRGLAAQCGIDAAPRAWGRLMAYGMPLVGSGLASFVLGTADRWLLADHVPAADLGRYAVAAKIALIAAMLTQPFELWWYPRRLGLLQTPQGQARSARIVMLGIVLTLGAAAGTSLIGPLLIRLLTPPAYHAACAFVPWLALALAMQSIGSLVNAGCYARRTGMLPLIVNAAAAAVALGFYLLLIPRHGVWGAIEATLAAQLARMVLFFILSERILPLPWRAAWQGAGTGAAEAGGRPGWAHGWRRLMRA